MVAAITPVLAVFLGCVTFSGTENVGNGTILLPRVLNTIEKLGSFFGSDYSSINVDGLFGLRVAQGQVKLSISECRAASCTADVMARLMALDDKMETIASKAMPYIEDTDPKYFQRFRETIARPYVIGYHPETIDLLDQGFKKGTSPSYDEEKGDACYARLMGTYTENGNLLPKCNVTDACLEMMLHAHTARYVTTHQLLYFIVLEHMGCKNVGDYEEDEIRVIQEIFCTRIYREARSFVTQGNVHVSKRDLFLEQTMLCGSLGFEDFMKADWIRMVLRWPDTTDWCFKLNKHDLVEIAEESVGNFVKENKIKDPRVLKILLEDIDQLASKQYSEIVEEGLKGNRASMRKPLREQTMKDGCLSHTTGLGIGVFGVYLRYLLRLV
ncbi:hypothetical protein ScPMuIL_005488 [Solemya velum]